MDNAQLTDFITAAVKTDSKKQSIDTYILNRRIEWMQQLKKYVSEYLDEIYRYNNLEREPFFKYFHKVQQKTTQLKLHLNYIENADKNILNEVFYVNRLLQLKNMEETIKGLCPFAGDMILSEDETEHAILQLRIFEYQYFLENDKVQNTGASVWRDLLNGEGDSREELREKYMGEISAFDEVLALSPQKIIIYAEVYLKTEWERVIFEIENGSHQDYDFDNEYKQNLQKKQSNLDSIEEFISERGAILDS